MTPVECKTGYSIIDTVLLMDAFGLLQDEIKVRMGTGIITSRRDADKEAAR